MKSLKILLITLISIASFSCKPQKSNRQIFEENLEVNVEACMKPFIQKGMDSITSASLCRCILNTVYEIDSTVFQKELSEVDLFLDKYSSDILEKCAPLAEEYFPFGDD